MTSLRTEVSEWADKRGFGTPRTFQGSTTVVAGNPKARYSGFYLLIFSDDSYYLGESVDLRSRMGGHNLVWGPEIGDVRFIRKNLSKQQLRQVEKELIYELDGIVPDRCRNKTHASKSFGSDNLAEFLSEEEQARWLLNPRAFNTADTSTLKPMTPAQEIKYKTSAMRYLANPVESEATEFLRYYLDNCIPAPRRTEYQGWSVSTGTYGGQRLLCVSVGRMETLVVAPDASGFVIVRKSVLTAGTKNIKQFLAAFPGVRARATKYQDAGADTVCLLADSPEAFRRLISDERVRAGAAQLVFDVMSKHPCVYTRYHCPQVVEHAYPEYSRAHDLSTAEEETTLPSGDYRDTGSASMQTVTAPEPVSVNEDIPDDVELCWFVNAGTKASQRHSVADFISEGEWRMDPNPKYEMKVQEMLPGERIAVRVRRNITQDVPFDHRGFQVSVMDILLTGTIVANRGDGCSVTVAWNPHTAPRRWYLYTSQDTVWPVARRMNPHLDELFDFAFNGGTQDIDFWRNQPFWLKRFGDHD
ncbi:GIY-YIG nuclease family protein [Gordonia sp. NPDC003376]